MNKTGVKIKKPVHLVLSVLDIGKIVLYEYRYNYMKTKYGKMLNYSTQL